jgi:hypothetical protein
MRERQIVTETWPFQCLSCGQTWEAVYEAWHVDDGHGGDAVTWRHEGVASMPPWIEPACPACSGLCVKALPPGARRPAGLIVNGLPRQRPCP